MATTTSKPVSTPPRKKEHRSAYSSPSMTTSPFAIEPGKTKSMHAHKPSWEAFDPLLAATTEKVGTGVWGGSSADNSNGAHPLKETREPEESLLDLLKPVPVASGRHKSKAMNKPPSHRKNASAPSHKKTDSIEELRQIAQEISLSKPAPFVAEQDKLIESWQDNRRKAPPVLSLHRKSKSLGNHDILNMRFSNPIDEEMDEDEDALLRTNSRSAPNTPEMQDLRKKATSPNKSSISERMKQHKVFSTPEHKKRLSGSSFLTPTRWNNNKAEDNVPPPPDSEMPRLTPLHGFLTQKDNLTMRSSELEPSHHQVEIPSCDDFLMHSRLCAVMDQYRVVDQNFEFGKLVNTSRMALQGFVASSKNNGSNEPEQAPAAGLDSLIDDHAPIIQSVLECADDLVLEGFFCNDAEKNSHDRIEVAVFNCQSRRQFVVVYRGTTDQQMKPVRNKHLRAAPVSLTSDKPVGVFPAFRDGYFEGGVEEKVFGLLDDLSEKYPFCDVVMTGHSFGATLATIAALRFACDREMLCVSCHTFGSPKIGNMEWRRLVNSQPNLKVMRVEHSTDSCVMVPPDTAVYYHVGHSLQVQKQDQRGSKLTLAPSSSPRAVSAYRFEKNKPVPKNFLGISKRDNKADEMQSYVRSIEQFARLGQTWVQQYTGEDVGKGVRGKGNEKRQMV